MLTKFSEQFDSNKTYLVAVSGGVDSTVMLDMMSKIQNLKIIVAHFDHQIRGQESTQDALFVKKQAQQYDYQFVMNRGNLGQNASEDKARQARYVFLRAIAKQYQALICVAHHQDDIIETIALNLKRGTGWRGLAVMGAQDIFRPMLQFDKKAILNYANQQNLAWCEDSTNYDQRYLRNKIRQKLLTYPINQKQLLLEMYHNQTIIKQAIAQQADYFYQLSGQYDRYFWFKLDDSVAIELLRCLILQQLDWLVTRPRAKRALEAIRTFQPGTIFQMGDGIELTIRAKYFMIKRPKILVKKLSDR